MDVEHIAQVNVAQVNVGRLHAPIDAPQIAEFVANLEPVNAVADAAPGFVWRLQDDGGDATHIAVDEDPLVIINLSVWESLDALEAFVRSDPHLAVLRRRREWFARMAESSVALWWVPAGHRPTVAEAVERLAHLRREGPTPRAFTFRARFPSAAPVRS